MYPNRKYFCFFLRLFSLLMIFIMESISIQDIVKGVLSKKCQKGWSIFPLSPKLSVEIQEEDIFHDVEFGQSYIVGYGYFWKKYVSKNTKLNISSELIFRDKFQRLSWERNKNIRGLGRLIFVIPAICRSRVIHPFQHVTYNTSMLLIFLEKKSFILTEFDSD